MFHCRPENDDIDHGIESVLHRLLNYCRSQQWAGWDPYDALNSKLFQVFPVLDSRVPRLVLTQALKRSPLNLRSIFAIPRKQNPKGLALVLQTLLRLRDSDLQDRQGEISKVIQQIASLRSPGYSHWCWGYSFPWQTRTILVPTGAPNLVCTVFVANALLEAYEIQHNSDCLSMAVSAAEYILQELYWTSEKSRTGFAYPLPAVRDQVHNANFLASALFCRVFTHTGETRFLSPALEAARCSASRQNPDGSWAYGESSTQRWIDNFHTGYNLCALRKIGQYAGTAEFESCLRRGFEFYRNHFFCEDGCVRYFHNRTYPIDIHCVAQSVITLLELRDLDAGSLPLAQSVFRWAIDHMWSDRGFFYYRILPICTIRTSYMRWSQAWMLLCLSMLLQVKRELAAYDPEQDVSAKNVAEMADTVRCQ